MPKTIIAGSPAFPGPLSDEARSLAAKPVVPVLHHDGNTDRCATWIGEEDDAVPVLVVGRNAPDEKIQRLAAKHGMDALALRNFARGR